MLTLLIIIGLVGSTFLTGVLLDPLIPPITDIFDAKAFIAFNIAALIAFAGSFRIVLRCQNRWIMVFVAYSIMTIDMHPAFKVALLGYDIGGFWVYNTLLAVVVYYLMYGVLSNAGTLPHVAHHLNVRKIIGTLAWCGFLTSVYVVLQFFHLDQCFGLEPKAVILGAKNPHLTGFMGNRTIAAAFIAACLVPALYLNKRLFALMMWIALFLIDSKMALAGSMISLLFYTIFTKTRDVDARIVWLLNMVGLIAIGVLLLSFRHGINDNGRFEHWRLVYKDWMSPQTIESVPELANAEVKANIEKQNERTYPLTGIGPGAYQFVFVNRHASRWDKIHNEPGEVLYGWGAVGFVLFVLGVLSTLWRVFRRFDASNPILAPLFCSFVALLVCSCGSFPWQVEPTRFLSVLLLGLLNNQSLKEEYVG